MSFLYRVMCRNTETDEEIEVPIPNNSYFLIMAGSCVVEHTGFHPEGRIEITLTGVRAPGKYCFVRKT